MGERKSIEIDDRVILEAFQKEDKRALEYLYDKYLHVIYGVCLKYLKDRVEAQDATGDILEKFMDIKIPPDIHQLKAWIYVVTKNHCLMSLRKKKGITLPLSPNIDMEFDQELHPIDKELKKQAEIDVLNACIEALKNEQKNCVKMFYIQKLCYQDIVEQTGYQIKKVKSYIQNGKRNLKICIESNSR